MTMPLSEHYFRTLCSDANLSHLKETVKKLSELVNEDHLQKNYSSRNRGIALTAELLALDPEVCFLWSSAYCCYIYSI
jgi:hypothetical protein